jgi:kinesin family protein C2/C3
MLVICFQESVENGSAGKIVDCILSLKWFHESKQMNNQSGSKHMKSPLVMQSISRLQQRATTALPSDACRRLDLSATSEKKPPAENNFQKPEGSISQSSSYLYLI